MKTFEEDVLQIRLEDVFKRSWKTKSVTLKTSSRRLEDVLENKKCLLGLVQFGSEYSRISGVSVVYDKSINSALIIKALR